MEHFGVHKCLACGQPLAGRSDKKYCDDQCRSAYNNKNRKPHERRIHHVNSRLRKNRTILKSLCPTGKATVRKEVLIEMGFDFTSCTSFYGRPGKIYLFCYDYGYLPIVEKSLTAQRPTEKVLIIQQQPFHSKTDPWRIQ